MPLAVYLTLQLLTQYVTSLTSQKLAFCLGFVVLISFVLDYMINSFFK
jgi:hypothetical protein